jgi:prolipoprotein diacylglyceryltransferase
VDTLTEALGRGLHLAYVLPVLAGLGLALLFPSSRGIADPEQRRKYRVLQLCTLIGALVGAKLASVVGELGWPLRPVTLEQVFLETGRSITGGLLFGFLTAELLKPFFGYREPPNDRFASVLPFSIAIGRLGCLFAGCCRGAAWQGPWAMRDDEGVLRHPAPLYDLLFHLALGVGFVTLLRAGRLRGRLFALHLLAYGAFRFAIEPLRDTRAFALGLSAYQLFALAMIACGLFGLLRRLPTAAHSPVNGPAHGPAAA